MTVARGTTNRNQRGDTTVRAARRRYLLLRYGNGWIAPCHDCGVLLDFTTVCADRITPGHEGGTYDFENCRPSCLLCGSRQGAAIANAKRRAKKLMKG